jgi:hypothetical protein
LVFLFFFSKKKGTMKHINRAERRKGSGGSDAMGYGLDTDLFGAGSSAVLEEEDFALGKVCGGRAAIFLGDDAGRMGAGFARK